jgi:hypothetical protein
MSTTMKSSNTSKKTSILGSKAREFAKSKDKIQFEKIKKNPMKAYGIVMKPPKISPRCS